MATKAVTLTDTGWTELLISGNSLANGNYEVRIGDNQVMPGATALILEAASAPRANAAVPDEALVIGKLGVTQSRDYAPRESLRIRVRSGDKIFGRWSQDAPTTTGAKKIVVITESF